MSVLHLTSREWSAEERTWRWAIAIGVSLHVIFFLGGYLSRHNSLLDLINQGETVAVENVQASVQQQSVDVELVPPPPLEKDPEFVKPEEKPKITEVPKPKPIAPPVVQAPVENKLQYAANPVQVGNKNYPKPPYPLEAKVRHFQGTVVLSIQVSSGKVTNVEVLSSSGYGILDASASAWIKQHWKFPEGMTDNVSLPIKFELSS